MIWLLPPPLPSRQQVIYLSQSSCVSTVELLTKEWRGVRSQIILQREGLVFYYTLNTPWLQPSKTDMVPSVTQKQELFYFFGLLGGIQAFYKASLKTRRQIFSFSQNMELSISVGMQHTGCHPTHSIVEWLWLPTQCLCVPLSLPHSLCIYRKRVM